VQTLLKGSPAEQCERIRLGDQVQLCMYVCIYIYIYIYIHLFCTCIYAEVEYMHVYIYIYSSVLYTHVCGG
jgi:hypothetical protein